MSSEDYGKDLTGVQNLRKKHQRLEAEIHNHEPKVQVDKPLRVPACVYHSRAFGTSGNACLFKGELRPEISLLHMKVLTLIKAKSNVFL